MGVKNISVAGGIEPSESVHAEDGTKITQQEIFKVLSNDRRRCTIHYLKQHENETVPLRDIVDYVTAWENDVPVNQLDSYTRKSVYTALRQSHLPMLDDAGVIEYDQLRGEAQLAEAAREVKMYLDYVPSSDIPWHQYYLGLSFIFAALTGFRWAGLFPFGGLSWSTLVIFVIVLLVVSAIVQSLNVRKSKLENEAKFSIGH